MNATEATPKRNPWPIAIIAYFIAFTAFTVGLVIFAARQKVDLVRADYYEEEIGFQNQLDRMNRSQAFDAETAIAYAKAARQVTIKLPLTEANAAVAGSIHFYRPSDSSLDQEVKLAVDASGVQHVDARSLKNGLWKVRVQWKISDQEYFMDQAIVVRSTHGS